VRKIQRGNNWGTYTQNLKRIGKMGVIRFLGGILGGKEGKLKLGKN